MMFIHLVPLGAHAFSPHKIKFLDPSLNAPKKTTFPDAPDPSSDIQTELEQFADHPTTEEKKLLAELHPFSKLSSSLPSVTSYRTPSSCIKLDENPRRISDNNFKTSRVASSQTLTNFN
jgi:hypothetical protein